MLQGLSRKNWVIVALIFSATAVNYLDRQLIGLLKPALEKRFGWTEIDFSRIVMAFTASYALGLLVSGRFLDRAGTRIGYLVSVLVWSFASAFHALARSVGGFITARILLGLGEAGNFPAGIKVIAEHFKVTQRGLVTGIFNAGTSVGVVLALFITPLLMSRYGWESVFWMTGLLGIGWSILWLTYYPKEASTEDVKSPKSDALSIEQTTQGAGRKMMTLRELCAKRTTWAYVTGKLFIDPIFWFFLFWLPSYFSSTFKIDLSRPSPELMIIYASTTLGSVFGGYFSSRLIGRGMAALRARKMALLIFACIELSILAARYVTGVWAAVILISVAVAVHQAWATNIFTMATDLFNKENVSSVVGIGGMAGAIGGIAFPAFVGYLLEAYRQEGNITAGYNLVFTICGCTYLFAWLIIHLLTRKVNPDKDL
jgi:ACS family hexuronate transporter-like MFS transporter